MVASSKPAASALPLPLIILKLLTLMLTQYSLWGLSIAVGSSGHLLHYLGTRLLVVLQPWSWLRLWSERGPVKWTAARRLGAKSPAEIIGQAAAAAAPTRGSLATPYKVVCMGSGISGIGLAVTLLNKQQLQLDNFVVLERRGQVGGTWYDNTYPNCACDVPSNLYSYSFAPNPNWSHFFARQPEIKKYLNDVTDNFHVRPFIQTNTTVTSATWHAEQQLWQVVTRETESSKQGAAATTTTLWTQYLVSAMGALSNASFPNIPGRESFQGKQMHTAVWDNSYDFNGKRVAVVGTGASSIQTVPGIQQQASALTVFQRTPAWVVPRMDRAVTAFEKKLFSLFPFIQSALRLCVYWAREAVVLEFVYRWPQKYVNQQLVKFFVHTQVKDAVLREKLMPDWELGCKRILISNDWYSALQAPNTTLVTDAIASISSNSITTAAGHSYEVDAIVWSTGFQVQVAHQPQAVPIRGTDNVLLDDAWRKSGVQAYKGVTVPGFPNFFFLVGPNTGLGHNSMILMIESQLTYVTDALLQAERLNVRQLAVKREVCEAYNSELQKKLKPTVWSTGGCHSWYNDKDGNNTTLFPGFTWAFRLATQRFDIENYLLQKS